VILVTCAVNKELAFFESQPHVEVLVTGVGPVEAAASVSRALAQSRPELVINAGLAGRRPLEPGKNADVVLWSGDPFSVYTKAEKTWIDGAMLFDRSDPRQKWRTDFELGYITGGNR